MVFAAPHSAFAMEKLRYNIEISSISKSLIENHVKPHDGLDIAQSDLNDEGLKECFVRPSSCNNNKHLCEIIILARKKAKIIELGRISANDIALHNGYTQGVRNLAAFNDLRNDFKYDLYIWEPARSTYILK